MWRRSEWWEDLRGVSVGSDVEDGRDPGDYAWVCLCNGGWCGIAVERRCRQYLG